MNKKTIPLSISAIVIIVVVFSYYFYQKQKSQEAVVSPEQNEIPFLFGEEGAEGISSGAGGQKVPPGEDELVPEGLFE